jgi:DNA-directed RNA polymerase specialized sigma24 family protein
VDDWPFFARSDATEQALRALVNLRPALRRLEEELVVRARLDGLTWDEIADALGMSRQGAMRRHRHATWKAIRAARR